MLGDGLSHVAFGATTLAATLDVLDIGLTLPITILAAILILRSRPERRVMGDAVIAVISISSLAIGYTVLGLGGGVSNLGGDVCTALFGSSAILSVDNSELILGMLTDKQKETLEKFDDCYAELTEINEREIFLYAFRLGMRIAIEVFTEP